MKVLLRALMMLFVLRTASIAQDAIVRAALAEKGDLFTGQRATLAVELLAPGYFASAAIFDLPDPPGMLLIPPGGHPTLSTETIGDVSYTVQRHEILVFARRPGEQTIPPFQIRFGYKKQPLDKEITPATVQTPALRITVKQPPGAEKLGSILSARDLKVVETWKPEPGKAKAGDAFVRTIRFSAPGIPAMAFPPFRPGSIPGLGIYPKPPVVLDQDDRGVLHGERVEEVAYVCQRAGRLVIPAVKFTWWDLDAQKLQTVQFPERVLEVAPNPAMAAAATTPPGPPWWKRLAQIAGGLLLLGGIAFGARRSGIWKAVARGLHVFLPVHLSPLNPAPADSRAEASTRRGPVAGDAPSL